MDGQARRLEALEARCESMRLRRLVSAWRERVEGWRAKGSLGRKAERHWAHVRGEGCGGLEGEGGGLGA